MSEVIVRGGTIVTVDSNHRVTHGDVASIDGALVCVGGEYVPQTSDYSIIDASGCIVMPGLVQSHVHMCQTLARGHADDLELLDWLRTVVWPYEGALRPEELRASAELACAELLLGGTTAILDMGTVHHTDQLFEAAKLSGLRASIGKAMMDAPDPAIPAGLRESTTASLDESARLCASWHGREADRLRYAWAPRFALSCTDELLREAAVAARKVGARIHTHSSENRDEIAEVERRTGKRNIFYLAEVGLVGEDVCLAHCIWLSDAERELLAETKTKVLHCPSSNLKLSSGIAEVPALLAAGIDVSIGADGAPCNNNLDGFLELRLAALLHKPRFGSKVMPAPEVVRMATLGGARALGLQDRIGSLEIGKRADVICVSTERAHLVPCERPLSTIAYAARSSDVRHVIVDGQIVVRDRELLTLDESAVLRRARDASRAVFSRLAG